MKVNIEKAKTLIKKVSLINYLNDDGMNLTLNLQGTAGLGKSSIAYQAADEIGGHCFAIDVTTIQESELSGFPFKTIDENGDDYVEYSPFYAFAAVRKLEKRYYLQAKSEVGLLDGRIKLNENDDIIIKENDKEIIIKNTIDKKLFTKNNYSFGDNLPERYKFELLNEGDIQPVIILFDELNRASRATLAETMNILLYHRVQSYKLPWWVNIIAATNPGGSDSEDYVQRISGAQKSRLLTVNIMPDVMVWGRHAIRKGFNNKLVEVLMNQETMCFDNHTQPQDDEAQTDARSWTFVSKLIDKIERINNFDCLDESEKDCWETDLDILAINKVGVIWRTVSSNMKSLNEIPKPSDILNGGGINNEEIQRLRKLESIKKYIFVENLLMHMARNIDDMLKPANSDSYLDQFAAIYEALDNTNQSLFVKSLKDVKTNIENSTDTMTLFDYITNSRRKSAIKWQDYLLTKVMETYKSINAI